MKENIDSKIVTPANVITALGFPLAAITYYFLYSGELIKGLICYVILALSDLLDGFVARNKTIQKLFGGRGESKLGKALDPARDITLRLIVFILAKDSLFLLGWTIIIALAVLAIFWFYNRKINKHEEEVTVSRQGKWLHAFDCIMIAFWILVWALHQHQLLWDPNAYSWVGHFVLLFISVTTFARYRVYKDAWHTSKQQPQKQSEFSN